MTYRIPYGRMDIVNLLHRYGDINSIDYNDDEIQVDVNIHMVQGEKIMALLHSK